ncbi:sigma 54-interacting transcriptional regulator, partial [Vibrio parahaemolyticus]|uniref:sigma 54-interacting transcriptional regulator n=1 Tax=Vibrio parahaemolyticus TaxID=670 RepID=UPI001469B95D
KGLLNSGWQGIIIANEDGQVLAHNQVASQLFAQKSIIGQSLDDILSTRGNEHPFVFKTKPLTDKDSKVKSRAVAASNDLHYGGSAVEHCWQQANRVIDKDISLLILGETGVGKNEFVKAL